MTHLLIITVAELVLIAAAVAVGVAAVGSVL